MGHLVCFKCRAPLEPGSAYCAKCGTSYSGGEEDPEAIRSERSFLLEQAITLSDLDAPTFLGFPEEELSWRSERRPTLPLGLPVPDKTAGLEQAALLSALDSSDAAHRGHAALALADHPDPEVVFTLLKHLGDRDSDVRTCILWALGRSENPLVVPPLLEYRKVEKDKAANAQLAATLYHLVMRAGRSKGARTSTDAVQDRIAAQSADLLDDPTAEGFVERGRLHIRAGQLLKAIGDFSRAVDDAGVPVPRALLYRSQSFLLMGKPLFSLDDLLVLPEEEDYPPFYYLHRAALLTLSKQIAQTAREKGLDDYARLFERRLDKLRKTDSQKNDQ